MVVLNPTITVPRMTRASGLAGKVSVLKNSGLFAAYRASDVTQGLFPTVAVEVEAHGEAASAARTIAHGPGAAPRRRALKKAGPPTVSPPARSLWNSRRSA